MERSKWQNGTTRHVAMAAAGLVGGGIGYGAMVATGYPHVGFLGLLLVTVAMSMVGEALGPWRDEVEGHRVGDPVLVLWGPMLEWTPAYVVGFGHGATDICCVVESEYGVSGPQWFRAADLMGLGGGAA